MAPWWWWRTSGHRLAGMTGRRDRATGCTATAGGREVAVPLVAGVVIIVMVFLPLLTLQGLEGRLFGPVALTIVFALGLAAALADRVPVLARFCCRPVAMRRTPAGARLEPVYEPVARLGDAHRADGRRCRAGRAGAARPAVRPLGKTFMPMMDEGTSWCTVRKHATDQSWRSRPRPTCCCSGRSCTRCRKCAASWPAPAPTSWAGPDRA